MHIHARQRSANGLDLSGYWSATGSPRPRALPDGAISYRGLPKELLRTMKDTKERFERG